MKCPKCQADNPDTQKYCGECATPLTGVDEAQPSVTKTIETAREELTTGSTFAGRYQIIEELGKGGMGKVYKAIDTKINEKIALKLIKPEIASDKEIIERFSNELKMARKIGHRNVGRMFHLGEDEGTHFITMEYVPGEDLKSFIRRSGQLTVGKTISIAKQICAGLAEAHSLGVVHRDLKPSNIMIDKEGNARIMDFGIARSLKGKGITGAGVIIGTPEYMSPEQVDGKEADQRSDMYSLGVILYEMLTGMLPFEGDTPLSIAVQHRSDAPKDPKELNPQIPDDLCHTILRCMEKAKGDRYQTIVELSASLNEIERGIPSLEIRKSKRIPITSKEITVSFAVKRIFPPAIAVIVLAIVGLILWHPWSKKELHTTPLEKPSVAVLPFNDSSQQKDQGALCDGIPESIIVALSKVESIKVSAATASFTFRGIVDLDEIGDKLKVKAVLKGSLQKYGDRIRIRPELVNIIDKSLLWTENFEFKNEDIFDIQDEITLKIIESLKVELLREEETKVLKRYTENAEAYNLYLEGLYLFRQRTENSLRRTREKFEQAIELDSNFALANVGISKYYSVLPFYSISAPKEVYPKAKEHLSKALKIDNTLADAHEALGLIKWCYDWDWIGAEKEYQKAIELNPSSASAHAGYSDFLHSMGRIDEAIETMDKAIELDPISMGFRRTESWIYYTGRQYDKAIDILQNIIELNPIHGAYHLDLGRVFFSKGLYQRALEAFEKGLALWDGRNSRIEAWIGITYTNIGLEEEAEKILNELLERSKSEYVYPFVLVKLSFDLGEMKLYRQLLNRAYEEKDNVSILLNYPPYENIRSDEACIDLLKMVKLIKD
jgi:serine/threonine-protein kinase